MTTYAKATMLRHSPINWWIEYSPICLVIRDRDGQAICEIAYNAEEWELHQGNARLIAAAPRLLLTLRIVQRVLRDDRKHPMLLGHVSDILSALDPQPTAP